MRIKYFLALTMSIISIIFISCSGDMTTELGRHVQLDGDTIILKVDTFQLSTSSEIVDYEISRPDSFLLGLYKDNIYGTTGASILTQFMPPVNYHYMDSTIATTYPDSVVVTLNYYATSFFGKSSSPMQFKVYELKNKLDYNANYYTNINPNDYVNFSMPLDSVVETIDSAAEDSRTGLNSIRIKLSNKFVTRFFSKSDSVYKDKETFLNFFKGLYITRAYGSATLINIHDVTLTAYNHYVYKNSGETVPFPLTFSSSNEVKQVNSIIQERNPALLTNTEYNQVCAPANYYTKISIPIGRMRDSLNVGNRHLVINSAILDVNVANKDSLGTKLPYVSNMMLVRADKLDNFFANGDLPSDTTAFVESISKKAITSTTYSYYYRFSSLATLIQDRIENTNDEVMEMYLVPVIKQYASSTSTTVSKIIPSYIMEAAAVYSGTNSKIPMKLKVVYSGF